jgi:superoxide reductase
METKFYRCEHCGNIVLIIQDGGVTPDCCNEAMFALSANTVDASKEKHVPVVKINKDIVEVFVGDAPHPMQSNHWIQWIYIETKAGSQIKYLNPEEKPYAKFSLVDDQVISVYEYCNLHGLWKTTI